VKRRKRAFILLEVFLGFALTAILLAFITTTFFQYIRLLRNVEKGEEIVLSRAHLYHRLATLHDSLAGPIEVAPNSLSFPFENGTDIEPSFSGCLFAKIYLKKEKELCFRVEGKEEGVFREEILLRNVESMEVLFYDDEGKGLEEVPLDKQLPLFFTLVIMQGGKTLSFPVCSRIDPSGAIFYGGGEKS